MIIPNYETLFKPYTTDGATLENSIAWLRKKSGSADAVVEQVIAEVMTELAEGKSYMGECTCGCEITNIHTKLEHEMLARCKALDEEAKMAYMKILQQRETARILAHIHADNEAFTEKHNVTPRLINWEKSPVLKGLKWISSQFQA